MAHRNHRWNHQGYIPCFYHTLEWRKCERIWGFQIELFLLCELLCPPSSLDSAGFMFSSRLHLVGSTFSCTPESAGPGAGQRKPRISKYSTASSTWVSGGWDSGGQLQTACALSSMQARREMWARRESKCCSFYNNMEILAFGEKESWARLNKRLVCFLSRTLESPSVHHLKEHSYNKTNATPHQLMEDSPTYTKIIDSNQ